MPALANHLDEIGADRELAELRQDGEEENADALELFPVAEDAPQSAEAEAAAQAVEDLPGIRRGEEDPRRVAAHRGETAEFGIEKRPHLAVGADEIAGHEGEGAPVPVPGLGENAREQLGLLLDPVRPHRPRLDPREGGVGEEALELEEARGQVVARGMVDEQIAGFVEAGPLEQLRVVGRGVADPSGGPDPPPAHEDAGGIVEGEAGRPPRGGEAFALEPLPGPGEERPGHVGVVEAFEETEETDPVAVAGEMAFVPDRGDAARHLAPAPREKKLRLRTESVVEEPSPRRVDLLPLHREDRRHPRRQIPVDPPGKT